MRIKRISNILVFLFTLFLSNQIYAQIGGGNIYSFLKLSPSARLEALGGVLVPLNKKDINLVYQNPALLDTSLNNYLGVSSVLFPGGINHGLVSYALKTKRFGTLGMHIQYVNYGRFQRSDAGGNKTGSFYASETAIALSWSGELAPFKYGFNFKVINSFLEQYYSFGLALDASLMYVNELNDFFAVAAIKNVGKQIISYTGSNNEKLPFDIQLSIGQKLEHVPMTFIGTFHHLYKWDIRYSDPNIVTTDVFLGDSTVEKSYLFDKAMRHFVLGVEFNLSRNMDLRMGYNYLRRHELLVKSKRSSMGFSWGISFKIKKFKLDFSRSKYHVSGTTNNISLTLNMKELKKKTLNKL
ncbi:MAG TPA: type IX secretion system protein PorQ [Bacteroidetes bacterium]|nr:type IX secretion system protein PorQ [Bacteroidota bacterium]